MFHKPYPLTSDLKALSGIFRRNGFQLYVVGGAVRDFLLGKSCDDVDLTTDANPDEMLALFPRCIKTGIKHGTLTIPFRGKHYECTTFRTDGDYSDSRHPDKVDFTKSIHEDLKRRDFTVNALCADCSDGRIIDDFDGIGDMRRRIIRTVGVPDERFAEDALRLVRALRFASVLNFKIEPETMGAIAKAARAIVNVSVERINCEFSKMLICDHAGYALELLLSSGLLANIIPEISCMLEQGSRLDGLKSKLSDNSIAESRLEIRLGLFFGDMDWREAEAVLKRLRFSNRVVKTVTAFIRNELPDDDCDSVVLKRLIRNISKGNATSFLDFARIRSNASERFGRQQAEMRRFLAAGEPVCLSDLCVSGADMIRMGLKGKRVGELLEKALEMAYRDPSVNSNKEAFLGKLRAEFAKGRF